MRATVMVPLAGLLITVAAPGRAEEDYRSIVEVLRACSEIQDSAARMTCYDTNVRPRATGSPSVARAPSNSPSQAAPVAPVTRANAPAAPPPAAGFGAETLPQARPAAAEADEIEAKVASARERQPGKFVLVLEDGAEWEFVEAAPDSYNPPRAGSSIRIERGSLGSFRLRYASQRAIRIRRVN